MNTKPLSIKCFAFWNSKLMSLSEVAVVVVLELLFPLSAADDVVLIEHNWTKDVNEFLYNKQLTRKLSDRVRSRFFLSIF